MRERPSLHALAVYLAFIEHGTMTAAAEAEGISQPAISMHVKALERYYGTRLLERSGRRVRPTPAGDIVADYARRIISLTDELTRSVADLEGLAAGRLVIGASSTVGEQFLPELLGRFHQEYPGVTLSLSIGNTDEITQAVRDRSLDLGIVGRDPGHAELVARAVFDDALDLFVARDHPRSRQGVQRLNELTGDTFVLREVGSATRDLALQALRDGGCVPGDTIELGSNEAVKRAVAAGLGIGVLSTHSLAIDRGAGVVVNLPIANWHCTRQFWLIHRADRHLAHAERTFITLLG